MNILAENEYSWPLKVTSAKLMGMVKQWHHTPQDFVDGRITKHLRAYPTYELKSVALSSLDLEAFSVDDHRVEQYADLETEAPPIVVGQWGLILDGNHRALAAVKRGEHHIQAYVGIQQVFESEDDRPETPPVPPVLYHGTTPYNAALITLSGHIEVNESRDEDDHDDHSVCTTERADVAEWFYDVARAVDQPFGFVFHIDTSKIMDHMRPFEAETAGVPEYEWRVYGDIPISAVTKITLAGYKGTTKADMREYVSSMETGYGYDHRSDEDEIVKRIMSLIKKASK